MKGKQQKEPKGKQGVPKAAKRKVGKHGFTTVVKYLLWICHIVLCYLFYFDASLWYVAIDLGVGFALSALYWFLHKGRMFDDVRIENGMRFILSYVLMSLMSFFYTLAMIRSDELTNPVKVVIILSSFFVFFCLYSASRGLLQRKDA